MDRDVENWLRLAERELAAARLLASGGHALYVVFACHQAAEKGLKALIALDSGSHPPRTHDLLVLSTLSGAAIPDRFSEMLAFLNQSFMDVRYPMDLDAAMASYPLDRVAPVIGQMEDLLRWARSRLTSSI